MASMRKRTKKGILTSEVAAWLSGHVSLKLLKHTGTVRRPTKALCLWKSVAQNFMDNKNKGLKSPVLRP